MSPTRKRVPEPTSQRRPPDDNRRFAWALTHEMPSDKFMTILEREQAKRKKALAEANALPNELEAEYLADAEYMAVHARHRPAKGYTSSEEKVAAGPGPTPTPLQKHLCETAIKNGKSLREQLALTRRALAELAGKAGPSSWNVSTQAGGMPCTNLTDYNNTLRRVLEAEKARLTATVKYMDDAEKARLTRPARRVTSNPARRVRIAPESQVRVYDIESEDPDFDYTAQTSQEDGRHGGIFHPLQDQRDPSDPSDPSDEPAHRMEGGRLPSKRVWKGEYPKRYMGHTFAAVLYMMEDELPNAKDVERVNLMHNIEMLKGRIEGDDTEALQIFQPAELDIEQRPSLLDHFKDEAKRLISVGKAKKSAFLKTVPADQPDIFKLVANAEPSSFLTPVEQIALTDAENIMGDVTASEDSIRDSVESDIASEASAYSVDSEEDDGEYANMLKDNATERIHAFQEEINKIKRKYKAEGPSDDLKSIVARYPNGGMMKHRQRIEEELIDFKKINYLERLIDNLRTNTIFIGKIPNHRDKQADLSLIALNDIASPMRGGGAFKWTPATLLALVTVAMAAIGTLSQ